ncbi:uncharacterized protein FA14DRAFT_153484 [Meira miltonrushii]|uniref:Uncharacterized protein n=1 Tax=Meira miltonrushii TaxID=1280837 RepID=A0A316VKN1_9BASI|nr:uncharacterized protein FA14DRAFT_153484 [Meira miltonrushii]PWN38152.1 hypothetical protein FA14DRAFT_153484 [Meira miltonrushii]
MCMQKLASPETNYNRNDAMNSFSIRLPLNVQTLSTTTIYDVQLVCTERPGPKRSVDAVSVRRRLHMFGQDPFSPPRTTEYMHPYTLRDIKNRAVQQVYERKGRNIHGSIVSEVASPESSALTMPEQEPEQVKRKGGGHEVLIKEPKRKSTEAVRKWFARKREERKRGDKKAIEFFAKRNRYNNKKVREKIARIQQGTATPLEQEQYKNFRNKQKQWKDNNREKRNAYLRNRPSIGVSIRKKKRLPDTQSLPNQTTNPPQVSAGSIEQQPVVAAPETSTIAKTSAATPSKRKKKPFDLNLKPPSKKKSTEAVKAFYNRKKEARQRGDPKAIEFFKNESLRRSNREKRKREKVFSGEATQAEEEVYQQILARNRKYKHDNLLQMIFLILPFESRIFVNAVSVRRRLRMFGQDPFSPPKTTEYMHPYTLRDIKNRSVQQVYERKGKEVLGSAKDYVPSTNRVHSRKIEKGGNNDRKNYIHAKTAESESGDTQSQYTLRSKAANHLKKVSCVEYDDGGYDTDSIRRPKDGDAINRIRRVYKESSEKEHRDATLISSKDQPPKKYPNKWYWQQKALRNSGDVEAKQNYTLRNRREWLEKKARRKKVIDGTATEHELQKHKNFTNTRKKYSETHREQIAEYKRRYHMRKKVNRSKKE